MSSMINNVPSVVLRESESLEDTYPKIKGYDFNNGVNYLELLKSMASTGFQASNLVVGDSGGEGGGWWWKFNTLLLMLHARVKGLVNSFLTTTGTSGVIIEAIRRNMQFEHNHKDDLCSSHDGRVLRDAISMPQGLRVPNGSYWLTPGIAMQTDFLLHTEDNESVLDDDDNDDEEEEELENKDESEDMEYVLMAASSYDRGRGKNKHFWKEKEVEVLVDVLQELDSDPLWKVDGGFKNNYMVEVRKRMAQNIPNLDKEANPHIDSKIKYLRNKYNPISEMLMQSGCQWDDVGNGMMIGTHKNADGQFNFKLPYLHKLDMVWGRDRATGLKAKDISEACEDTNNQATTVLCSSDDSEDEVLMVPETQPGPSIIHATKKRKKVSPPTESSYKKKKAMTPQQDK
ncbi:Myb/SANT-like domain-containing protein [Tanacetum coccineum]